MAHLNHDELRGFLAFSEREQGDDLRRSRAAATASARLQKVLDRLTLAASHLDGTADVEVTLRVGGAK